MSAVLQFYSMGRPGNMSRPAVVGECLDLDIYICLRSRPSRPIDPDVVCVLVHSNVENSDQMND